MKKKIVFFSNNMKIGGMEKALLILLNSLDIKKYDITLYLEEKKGVLLKEIKPHIVIKELKTSKSKNIAFRKTYNILNRITWIIKNKNKYDFSCNYSTYFVLGSKLALAASKNSLLYVHSDYYNLYKKNTNEIKKFFNNIEMSKFRKVAFVANEAKSNLLKIYPKCEEKFIVLNNLFDYKNVLKLSKEEIVFKKNKDTKLLIFIGRLEEESKNITRLLNIMQELKEEKIDLIVIGDGKDKDMYSNIIKKKALTNVKMLGEKTNPYPYLKIANALILTSNYEGYPVVFSEALTLGKPIISTLKVTDEYLKIDKKNALILNNDQKDSELIKKILIEKQIAYKVDFKHVNQLRLKDIEGIINWRF